MELLHIDAGKQFCKYKKYNFTVEPENMDSGKKITVL